MMSRLISCRVQASRYSAIRSMCQLCRYVVPGSTVWKVLTINAERRVLSSASSASIFVGLRMQAAQVEIQHGFVVLSCLGIRVSWRHESERHFAVVVGSCGFGSIQAVTAGSSQVTQDLKHVVQRH